MHQRLLWLGAALQLALFSCQKNTEPAPQNIEQLMPLQVGNEWRYREYLYDSDGNVYDSTRIYTRSVVRDTLIDNNTWFILSDRSIVQNLPNGFAAYNAAGRVPVLVYQAKNTGGVGYNYQYPTYNLWVYTVPNHLVQPLPQSRQKFAGNLYRVEYTYTYTNPASTQVQKREDWLVPGVGLARWDSFYRDSDKLQRRRELISYTLK